ncbi:MAG: 2-dehydro-3-deoxygalactonokinase [Christensenellales bacterium]
MHLIYFDSGTSNTRMYLIENWKPVDVSGAKIGSKDSSIAGTNLVLLEGIKKLYDEMLAKHGLTDGDIEGIYCSGMISSPFGIHEVPHLCVPASVKMFHDSMYTHFEDKCFHRDVTIIRGMKTIPDGVFPTVYEMGNVNNVRGEEIEMIGILADLAPEIKKNVAIIMPGSHSQSFFVQNGEIKDMLSTFSGELNYAITSSTILGGSITGGDTPIDEEMLRLGCDNLREYGFCRAIYIIHASKIFNSADNFQRRYMLEGVITGSVIEAFLKKLSCFSGMDHVVVAASKNYMRCYEIVLNYVAPHLKTNTVFASSPDSFSVRGFLEIMKKGN